MDANDKTQPETTDLTTPDAIQKSQDIYARIESGQCKDATAELNNTHGTKG